MKLAAAQPKVKRSPNVQVSYTFCYAFGFGLIHKIKKIMLWDDLRAMKTHVGL